MAGLIVGGGEEEGGLKGAAVLCFVTVLNTVVVHVNGLLGTVEKFSSPHEET